MPRGGARPGAGRPRKNPVTVKKTKGQAIPAAAVDAEGFKTDPTWPFGQEKPAETSPAPDLSALTPLDYLLEVMRDPAEDKRVRLQAAQLAAPYVHAKKGEVSKKAEANEKAKEAAATGKFSRRAPPRLVASGGSKV